MDTKTLIGKRFGRLIVERFSHADRFYRSLWVCKCDCGNFTTVVRSSLLAGSSRSCGCLLSEAAKRTTASRRRTHKIVDGKEYKRCYKCKEWLEPSCFFGSEETWDKLQKICKNCHRKYVERNSDALRTKRRGYERKRRSSDPTYRVILNLRNRIAKALKGIDKSRATMDLLGCTIDYFKRHLEEKFTPEMNWGNYGIYWHVDHRIPCAEFDLSDPEQQRVCFHYTNLQPMFWRDNLKKNRKLKWAQE